MYFLFGFGLSFVINIASRTLLKMTRRKPKSSTGKSDHGGLKSGGQALKAFLGLYVLPV